jgi:hypothetical protein
VQLAELFVSALGAYAVAGAAFAIAFLLFGIQRVDPVAEHSSIGFRLMVLPGVAAIWPLLLARWIRSGRS